MEKDAKTDRFMNPRTWQDVEKWRYVYNLDYKEVITAMEEYWKKESTNLKGARGFQENAFKMCEIIEAYRYKHKKIINGKIKYPSVYKAILATQFKLLKFLPPKKVHGITLQEIDMIDQKHRRLVKEKPKVWEYWLQCRDDALAANKINKKKLKK